MSHCSVCAVLSHFSVLSATSELIRWLKYIWLLVDSVPLDHRGQFKHSGRRFTSSNFQKKDCNSCWGQSQMTHETLPQGGNLTTADEEEHRTSASAPESRPLLGAG